MRQRTRRFYRITIERLSDHRLAVNTGSEVTIFKEPLDAATFIQLLINRLQAEVDALTAGGAPDDPDAEPAAPTDHHAD